MKLEAGQRALFLDRDGTLIRDVGYPKDPERVELLDGVVAALKTASALGYRLVIVSNQSGVGRGILSEGDVTRVQERVSSLFAEQGIAFDGTYFCFHGPTGGCGCRKPFPGMLLQAVKELGIDPSASIMIGDKPSDVEAGLAAGCTAVSFGGGAARSIAGASANFASWQAFQAWLEGRAPP